MIKKILTKQEMNKTAHDCGRKPKCKWTKLEVKEKSKTKEAKRDLMKEKC